MLNVLVTILIVVDVVAALLLIGIILIQQTKAGGGLGVVGGAMTETFLGPTAGNFLTKATVIIAAVFLCTTLLLAIITGHRRASRSIIEEMPPEAPAVSIPLPEEPLPASDAEPQATLDADEPQSAGEGSLRDSARRA